MEMEGEQWEINPFLLFPEEVWAIILGYVEDSSDIQNSFRAIPELEMVMIKKRHLWLADQVIPHVFRWLHNNEVLACRRVSQRWFRAVNNFLENHPAQRALRPEQRPITGQVVIPRASARHYNLWHYFEGVTFEEVHVIRQFLQDMAAHSPKRNPFIGRVLNINLPESNREMKFFLSAILELLRKFGQHLWSIHVTYERVNLDFLQLCQFLWKFLVHLPNLKRLSLVAVDTDVSDLISDDELELEEDGQRQGLNPASLSFPPLAHLESLEIDYESFHPYPSQNLTNPLMPPYGSQLRRLHLPICFWKEEHSNLFPNLTELYIYYIISKQSILNLMQSINAPQLTNLYLSVGKNKLRIFMETDIVPWLRRFPRLASFELSTSSLPKRRRRYGRPSISREVFLPSIKNLIVPDGFQVNDDWLLYFPSLEYLKITTFFDIRPTWLAHFTHQTRLKISNFLHGRARDLYASNVWELLPKLKGVTVTGFESTTHFNRDTYDYLRELAAPPPPPPPAN